MLDRHPAPGPSRGRWALGLLVALVLAPLGVLGLSAAPATAAVGCLAQADKTGCVSGTVGSRSDPVEGADVQLLDEGGVEIEVQTTEADGKFAFTLTEPGTYLVKLDEDTLPDGVEQIPPAAAQAGPDGTLRVEVQLGRTAVPDLEVRSEDYDASGTSKTDQLVGGAFSGLKLGLLLALASLGLSLIYGTTGLSNFAHAEQVTLGGVVAYFLVSQAEYGLNLWVGIILTTLLCAGSGLLQDVVMWKPLRRRGLGLTQLMIVTIGLSLALQYAFQYVVGGSQVKVTLQSFESYSFGPVNTNSMSLIAMGIAIVMIGLVGFVLLRTRLGQATRAVSDNPALASASGIDVDRIVRIVWTASAGLAGLSGVLYALTVSNGIRWDTGMQILLLLFAAVTLGGLGTAFGALVGSLIIGLVVELAGPLGAPGDLKYAVALGILIILLMFRPQGLLGRAGRVG
ncbi:branched-chain amino acid ABC transporter permease [Nocardioides sp. SYSU D00038]|uniref:ABC transporter permease subunit n=1 Tax=Nocardioides sp. SYSU D00038 TaxID=2812554 RepID=UPI0019670FFA|nr:branched-chain amino acid ABC transporter permease [Nocardioides sp. SYSU D00038]